MQRILSMTMALASLTLGCSASRAASITWGPATNIAGDADVRTGGSLVAAYNFGGRDVGVATINGVAFQPFAVAGNPSTHGGVTIAESPGILLGLDDYFGSASAPFTDLSSAYQAMLRSGGFTIWQSTLTLTLDGLAVGQAYEIQIWSNFSDAGSRSASLESGGSVDLDWNPSGVDGGLGQFVVGSFVADSASQSIRITGSADFDTGVLVNGLQLRTAAAVPEPAGLVLMAVGAASIAWLASRRRTDTPQPGAGPRVASRASTAARSTGFPSRAAR
ncbi:PEP-CTERM sorting domain-containing protein [Paludisphaera mucosa]|uniref:PEP-CTERM sorting domain-containing protein n=1 Tax=Paludisphaera mucosa TaxID=3030827 RepID=A0ABT6FBU4_9BACT|nr:PEP-CTERM sorting domain-containing protein [Paludisphaera mucosa]MDG3005062.1 PEP-CTERM sorting domain-containing protein [Paludisphaera mucosa]